MHPFISSVTLFFFFLLGGCASLPEVNHDWHKFPKNAYIEEPGRPYRIIGNVKSKVNFPTLDPKYSEKKLCRNYFNRAVKKLARYAKKAGGDAVVQVRSVVFLLDGKVETHKTPECYDDGAEGQVLAHGMAVKWVKREDLPYRKKRKVP